ncbi:MAG: hypothetical protein R3E68_00625 [Burkholderiaceae bacterium]
MFVVEIVLRLVGFGRDFWRDPEPVRLYRRGGSHCCPRAARSCAARAAGAAGVALADHRALDAPSVVGALLMAVPGLVSIVPLPLVIYYVFAVIANQPVRRRLS